jgi:hypothetical protein
MGGTHFPADDVAPELTADGEGDRRDKGKMEHGLGRTIPLPLPHFCRDSFLSGTEIRSVPRLPPRLPPHVVWRVRRCGFGPSVGPRAGLLPCLAGLRDASVVSPPASFVWRRRFWPAPFTVRRCEHYRRRCKIVAPCCKEVFPCRHCHNEATVCYWVGLLIAVA